MAAKVNGPQLKGMRAPGSRPAGSSAYPRGGSVDALADRGGVGNTGDNVELRRSTVGGGGTTVNSQPVRRGR